LKCPISDFIDCRVRCFGGCHSIQKLNLFFSPRGC
jgi:hypothetical protein